MTTKKQLKGKHCEELWRPLLELTCPILLEKLPKGADYRCGNTFYEIKSGKSGLTKTQRKTRELVESQGGKYHILRCK